MSEQLIELVLTCAAGSAIGSIPSVVIFYRIRGELVRLVDRQRQAAAAAQALPPPGAGSGAIAARKLRRQHGQGLGGWWAG